MDKKIQHLLFTSDLSQGSRYVFDYAVSLANLYGARMTIMHVMEEVSPHITSLLSGILTEKQLKEIQAKHKDEAMTTLVGKSRERYLIQEGLEMFCRDAVAETPECELTPDEVVITSGHVADEILGLARKSGCDLIVMGQRHRGALSEALLGNVVRDVLKRSKIPVLVVPLPEDLS